MLRAIHEKVRDFHIRNLPVGGFFLLALALGVAVVVLSFYWFLIDQFPRWVDKVAFIVIAMTFYGYHLREKRLDWLHRELNSQTYRVQLEQADLGLVNVHEANFGIIGKIDPDVRYRYVEITTHKVEVAMRWRDALKNAGRPYRYLALVGLAESGNNPQWQRFE